MLEPGQRMALFYADYSLGMLGLRDGPWKFIYELDSGRSKLFDVEKDPQEKLDLSEHRVEQARWYTQDLRSWSAAQKQLLRAAK
jgi:arylsulfatase A-like enzyme